MITTYYSANNTIILLSWVEFSNNSTNKRKC